MRRGESCKPLAGRRGGEYIGRLHRGCNLPSHLPLAFSRRRSPSLALPHLRSPSPTPSLTFARLRSPSHTFTHLRTPFYAVSAAPRRVTRDAGAGGALSKCPLAFCKEKPDKCRRVPATASHSAPFLFSARALRYVQLAHLLTDRAMHAPCVAQALPRHRLPAGEAALRGAAPRAALARCDAPAAADLYLRTHTGARTQEQLAGRALPLLAPTRPAYEPLLLAP